jgi:DNA sulfur modification protein DndB
VTKYVIDQCNILRGRVEMIASSCSVGSPRIFTISALDKAHGILLKDLFTQDFQKDADTCIRFWKVLEKSLPEPTHVAAGKSPAQEVKETYFYPYSIALQAVAATANQLIKERAKTWERELAGVGRLDWKRANPEWEGRAMNAQRLTTGGNHPILTRNLIKQTLGLKLTDEEQRIEEAFRIQSKVKANRPRSA